MNNNRRREIRKVIKALDNIKSMIEINEWNENIKKLIVNCYDDIFSIQMDEQDAFDNMPEGLQYSERGEKIEENAELLEECADMINDIDEKDPKEVTEIIINVIDILNDIII